MDILSPIWNPREYYFSFLLVNPPSWTQVSDATAPNPDAATDLSGIITTFLEKSSSHFMTPLYWSTFVNNLEHEWNGWTEHTGANPPTDARNPIQITWVPTEIRISSNMHTLVWKILTKEQATIRIPPGFGQPAPVRTVTLVSPEPETVGLELLESMDEIPYEGEEPVADVSVSEQNRALERKRIRQARLKAELSKLRAHRLAQRYFERYGDLGDSVDEDDSSLSSDSELGKI